MYRNYNRFIICLDSYWCVILTIFIPPIFINQSLQTLIIEIQDYKIESRR